MKINWGTGVVLAFGIFVVFILSFVFKVQSNQKYDNELVTDEYYKKEATVQDDIDKKQNANDLQTKVLISKSDAELQIVLPDNFDPKQLTGKVYFYRPSNQKLDFEMDLMLITNRFTFPTEKIATGIWEISVDWTYQNKSYLNKETLYF